jgi:hypothetical protein
MKDIREYLVWLEYTDGLKLNVEMWLDIDSCIEEQIRRSWESPPSADTGPKLANFKWDLCHRPSALVE